MPTIEKINVKEILESPCASGWLKQAIQFSLDRDPVDALCDIELLSIIMKQRFAELTGKAE